MRSAWDSALTRLRMSKPGWVDDSWWIASIPSPKWPDLPLENPARFRNPRRQFLADPIPLVGASDEYLVEQYRFSDRRGIISHLRLLPDGSGELREGIIEEPFHLSFPMSFAHDGRIYVVAEASRGGATFLWEVRVKEGASRRSAKIIDRPLRDIAVFTSRSGWHLLATELSPSERLVHYRAEAPLGPWVESPITNRAAQERLAGVPISVDAAEAGTAPIEAILPLQGHSHGYGTEIALARLTSGSEGSLVVEPGPIVSAPKPYLGVHSLAVGSSTALVDIKHLRLRTDRITYRLRPARMIARARRFGSPRHER